MSLLRDSKITQPKRSLSSPYNDCVFRLENLMDKFKIEEKLITELKLMD